jgi:hypothetical protein
MAKVRRLVSCLDKDVVLGYSFECPGCGFAHMFHTIAWESGAFVDGEWIPKEGPVWDFNGDVDNPTFNPSLLIYEARHPDGELGHPRCHLFLRDGKLHFLSDCGHHLAGQTIDLPEVV